MLKRVHKYNNLINNQQVYLLYWIFHLFSFCQCITSPNTREQFRFDSFYDNSNKQDLLRYTLQSNPDYFILSKSLDSISTGSNKLNESVKERTNTENLVRVQKTFTGAMPVGDFMYCKSPIGTPNSWQIFRQRGISNQIVQKDSKSPILCII